MFPGPGVKAYSASYQGPGDVVSGATAYWGLRGYNAAYSGNIANICDQATGATCADATWASGVLTLPNIGGSPCDNASNKCVIKKLYDQVGTACSGGTGTACDISDTTLADMPVLVVAGSASCPSTGVPCISISTAQCTRLMNGTLTLASPQDYTVIATAKSGAGGSNRIVWGLGTQTTFVRFDSTSNQLTLFNNGSSTSWSSSPKTDDAAWHAMQFLLSGTAGSASLNSDGAGSGNKSIGAAGFSSNTVNMATRSNVCSTTLNGFITELGIWPALFTGAGATSSLQVDAINSNAHSYWGF